MRCHTRLRQKVYIVLNRQWSLWESEQSIVICHTILNVVLATSRGFSKKQLSHHISESESLMEKKTEFFFSIQRNRETTTNYNVIAKRMKEDLKQLGQSQ